LAAENIQIFVVALWAPKDALYLRRCTMAARGHPKSLISVPIESVYATFF